MKKIYLVRHCTADGQPPEANLTEDGYSQAESLVEFFKNREIDRIISSPFRRAIQSIKPFGENKNIQVEIDDRLAERILSSENLDNWQSKLEATYVDLDLKFTGGESSKEAMTRILSAVEEVFQGDEENTIIVTHGNLMSLLLNHFDQGFGFHQWKEITNPDVFLIEEGNSRFVRVWENKSKF
ncbi:histidine phosphatase family protein [Anaerobacillus sp. CMMVII]|uniref:histidine phosphatase family protein n=1 Tax=Anaerobacillus sp. CMMVII TaxID=2755588 RepID=UPI0021B75DEF|nr:histidine phosphatase family protein [Anaerobacillus sp. CMMVII]MCT8137303.1 histidine phosphatase family protein [Anaerobacillus sp. CMMVII]